MLISVILPVIRPEKAERCIEALHTLEKELPAGVRMEIFKGLDPGRIGCPRMVEHLVAWAVELGGDCFLFLGDDTIPQPGMIEAALKAMATLPDGWGLVGLNDGTGRQLPTHWLADRRVLGLTGGEFFHTGYQHCFCDNELWDICREAGRYVYAEDAKLVHDHPLLRGEELTDPDLKRVYAPEVYEADRALYYRRKRERAGFRLAIGFPLVDSTVPVPFFTSFACLQKPAEYVLLTPTFPHGPWAGSIADARNSLVEQAREMGCTHLLMCDTDQKYPPDTLTKLLEHEVDVCGVRVHRRWPPFDVILYKGEMGRYKHVRDETCFCGDLVEVDATGAGCLLFDMAVFDRLPAPWFKLGFHTDGKPYGEDIYFCNEARKAGVRIFVDTSIEVAHLTVHEVGRGTYELFKKCNGFQWAEA